MNFIPKTRHVPWIWYLRFLFLLLIIPFKSCCYEHLNFHNNNLIKGIIDKKKRGGGGGGICSISKLKKKGIYFLNKATFTSFENKIALKYDQMSSCIWFYNNLKYDMAIQCRYPIDIIIAIQFIIQRDNYL